MLIFGKLENKMGVFEIRFLGVVRAEKKNFIFVLKSNESTSCLEFK
jgi:hypothetical protein